MSRRMKLPVNPHLHKPQFDVEVQERCLVQRGRKPLAPKLRTDLHKRGYRIFTGDVDDNTFERLRLRMEPKRPGEWLAIKVTRVKPSDAHLYIQVLAIWERGGEWEPEWEPLRDTVVGDQFSSCSQEALDHALHGLCRPLVDALGIPPAGALRKLLPASRECFRRRKCPLYLPRRCLLDSSKMPWCFEPEGVPDGVRETATRAIELWREVVYLVVVKES